VGRDSGPLKRLWRESDAVSFYRDAIDMLRNGGMTGAFAWCYSDYHPDLWDKPPLSSAPHERFFGIFRHDGTPKPAARVIRERAGLPLPPLPASPMDDGRDDGSSWLVDENPDEFYLHPKSNLKRLYHSYREGMGDG